LHRRRVEGENKDNSTAPQESQREEKLLVQPVVGQTGIGGDTHQEKGGELLGMAAGP